MRHREHHASQLASLKALARGADLAAAPRHVRTAVTGWKELTAAAVRSVRRRLRRLPHALVNVFANMAEQVPNPESRL